MSGGEVIYKPVVLFAQEVIIFFQEPFHVMHNLYASILCMRIAFEGGND